MTEAAKHLLADRMWKVADVADFLGVSPSWVYLHVQLGDLPYRRIGGLVRFFPDDVRSYARGEQLPAIPALPTHPKLG